MRLETADRQLRGDAAAIDLAERGHEIEVQPQRGGALVAERHDGSTGDTDIAIAGATREHELDHGRGLRSIDPHASDLDMDVRERGGERT